MHIAYFNSQIDDFLLADPMAILGSLTISHGHDLEHLQRNAWLAQIDILKSQLTDIGDGQLYFEFIVPRRLGPQRH